MRRSAFHYYPSVLGFLLSSAVIIAVVSFVQPGAFSRSEAAQENRVYLPAVAQVTHAAETTQVYLPVLTNKSWYTSPFGIDWGGSMSGDEASKTVAAGAGWVRMGGRISWQDLQPHENQPINWSHPTVAALDAELRIARSNGLTPIVNVIKFPDWATIDLPTGLFPNGTPSCAPIKEEYWDEFAAFMGALAKRYSAPEFRVEHWEIGNEPDVDPLHAPPGHGFGCWGDSADPYYGGERYGRMLKVVTPAIKAANPRAKVWLGGLLLGTLHINEQEDPAGARPKYFLKGVLEAGAAPYFDVVSYHGYGVYRGLMKDHTGAIWRKAAFLRETLDAYDVDKPLFLTETAYTCPSYVALCESPGEDFEEAKANYLVRGFTRGVADGLIGMLWFNDSWRHASLVKPGNPVQAYYALQQLSTHLYRTKFEAVVEYGEGVTGYSFVKDNGQRVHVVWSVDETWRTVAVPTDKLVRVSSRDGVPMVPDIVGSDSQISVGFAPVYIVRHP